MCALPGMPAGRAAAALAPRIEGNESCGSIHSFTPLSDGVMPGAVIRGPGVARTSPHRRSAVVVAATSSSD